MVISKKTISNQTYAIVVAEFNRFITQRLLDGCLGELNRLRIKKKNIHVEWVPGALEIPVAAQKFARKKSVAAVIVLGCVIRGETYHFELVADNVAQGVMRVSLDSGKPVIFGVITTETVDQAYKRSGDGDEHKGVEAAQAALEMARTLKNI